MAAGITLMVYLILWVVSRKRSVEGRGIRPILRMASWIYERLSDFSGENKGQEPNLKKLKKLYPWKEAGQLLSQYYVEKLGIVLTVILVGTVLGTAVSLQAEGGRRLQSGSVIKRGDYREPQQKLDLSVSVEGYPKQVIELMVSGRVPDKETADQLEQEFWELLKVSSLSGNMSWDAVCEDLNLQQSLENFPFTVEWSCDNPHVVDDAGNVKKLAKGEEEKVTLEAKVTYHEWEWTHALDVTVITSLTEEEQFYQELEQVLLEQEKESRQKADVRLPVMFRGKEIQWEERLEDHGFTLWILAVTIGVVIFFLKDKDLDKQLQERHKLLRDAYPGIVHKMELYLRAGLTTRGAFVRIAEEYLRKKEEGKESHPAYEEMLYTCRELGLGMTETRVYERFGSRCGIREYVRLGALLAQNVVKGNQGLSFRLKEEAEAALKEQMQHGRQLGEEASTKLLVPMVMMLGIVMVLIMIPAFGTF
ncbi:MAG: hypothetical protein IKV27_08055 [Lachnospiraceae bacterium]|nr:hypothetical protein [Lachnospiraceae bacterium]